MPIQFSCDCGKKYSVKDDLAGKKSKCVACGAAIVVPILERPTLGNNESRANLSACEGGESPINATHAGAANSARLNPQASAVAAPDPWVKEIVVACEANDGDKLKALLQVRGSINGTIELGNTALHRAALKKSYRCCNLLLENGANPAVENLEQLTPLEALLDFELRFRKAMEATLRGGAAMAGSVNDEEVRDIVCLFKRHGAPRPTHMSEVVWNSHPPFTSPAATTPPTASDALRTTPSQQAKRPPAERLKNMGAYLMGAAAIESLLAGAMFVIFTLMAIFPNPVRPIDPDAPHPAFIPILAIVGLARAMVIIAGALKMSRHSSKGGAMLASILAAVPLGGFCCVSSPVGIAALLLLSDPEIMELLNTPSHTKSPQAPPSANA